VETFLLVSTSSAYLGSLYLNIARTRHLADRPSCS
jgi:hypothetical protein